MNDFLDVIKITWSAVGAWIGFLIGGADGLIYMILSFMIIDYITGVLCVISEHKLSSDIGFRGLFRKILILALIGIGILIDVYVIK